MKAREEISLLQSALDEMQRDIDARHHELYDESVQLAASIGIQPSMPRVVQRQVHRANAPAATPEEYYKINLTRAFLDHCCQHIDRRFQEEVYSCYKGLYITPAVMLDSAASWKANVLDFCNYYRADLPNVGGLDAELVMWEHLWVNERNRNGNIPDRVSEALAVVEQQAFCNIYTILQILCTIPISSATCERLDISTLRYIKTYLRNTMTQDRLNGLALMYVHRDKHINLDQVIDLFAQMHPRRMRMADILQDNP